MTDFDSYNREIQPSAAISFNGRNFLAPLRGLKNRLSKGNEMRSIFQSPSSYAAISSGTAGPTQWSFRLDSLNLTFIKNCYIQFNITNTTGATVTLYNYHSFIDRCELEVSGAGSSDSNASATSYIWPEVMFLQELDFAVQGANFSQIAQNIGISTTLSSGSYPGLFETSGLAPGASAIALLKFPDPIMVQSELPVNLSKANWNLRIYWSSAATAYGSAVANGDIQLSDIKLNLTGLKLSERLHALLRQRLQAAPILCPIAYFRRFNTDGFVFTSGAMTQQPLLQSQGQIYGIRTYWTTNAVAQNRFRPLTTVVGAGAGKIALYSQSSGNYVMQSYSNSLAQFIKTLMFEREPYSPLPNLAVYDFYCNSDLLETLKTGAEGSAIYLSPNDYTLQVTGITSTTVNWYQLTLTAGVALMNSDGSISIRWYEA